MTPKEPSRILEPPRRAAQGKLRIGIVTPDILGPVRNGGVGTAYWEIANVLAKAGHGVTIFFAPTTDTRVEDFETWQRHYLNHGIALVQAKPPLVNLECQLPLQRSYAIYEQLRRYSFDLLHFPDMHGLGYYSLLGKKMGLDFESTVLAVQAHGPNSWHRQFNEQDLSTHDEILMDYMERKSIELADQVIVSHQAILKWFEQRNWRIESHVSTLPLPCRVESSQRVSARETQLRPNEIVFFGRIETRKGITTLCDALDLMAKEETPPFKVTFLGKPGNVYSGDAIEFVKNSSAAWPFSITFKTDLDREAAIAYLKEGKRIAILPYRAETYGYAFEECLQHRIPLLASALPVFTDRVQSESHSSCFFNGSASDLAAHLRTALKEGLTPALPMRTCDEIEKKWVDWHDQLPRAHPKDKGAPLQGPLVSVCITHRNRSEYLSQAIASIMAQTYQNFEIIVSDDASESPAAISYLSSLEKDFSARGWKVIRHSTRSGPGASRNRAVSAARGEYVLLMDDDNLAAPYELETFVRASLKSDSDILTCFFDRIQEKGLTHPSDIISRWLCLGDDMSSGFFSNVYGDMNSLVRRSAYLKLGGLNETIDVGCEDWEFFGRAIAHGLKLNVVPRALFYYRDHENSYTRKVDSFKSRLLPQSVYSRALPKGSLTALMSYVASKVKFDPTAARLAALKHESAQIYGEIAGGDLFASDGLYSKVLFDLSDSRDRERLVPLRQVALNYENARAIIDSQGSDPGFELIGCDLNGSERLLVEVEIECPKETMFQFFYRSTEIPEYDEDHSYSRKLEPGLNGFIFVIERRGMLAPFRLDPASSEGSFYLRRLIIRTEA